MSITIPQWLAFILDAAVIIFGIGLLVAVIFFALLGLLFLLNNGRRW